jgi:hypothetical protein
MVRLRASFRHAYVHGRDSTLRRDIMDKASRKELTREYRETPRPVGVFRVWNKVHDKSFVGTGLDLPATLNGQFARLRFGGHPNAALQKDWNELGAEAFEFEILDTLAPSEKPDYDPREDLRVLEELWLDRLAPYDDRGYNKRPKGAA